jgi:hypothetical protein
MTLGQAKAITKARKLKLQHRRNSPVRVVR